MGGITKSELVFIEARAKEKLHVQRRDAWGGRGGRWMLCGHVVPLYVGMTPVVAHEADEAAVCKRCLKEGRKRQGKS